MDPDIDQIMKNIDGNFGLGIDLDDDYNTLFEDHQDSKGDKDLDDE